MTSIAPSKINAMGSEKAGVYSGIRRWLTGRIACGSSGDRALQGVDHIELLFTGKCIQVSLYVLARRIGWQTEEILDGAVEPVLVACIVVQLKYPEEPTEALHVAGHGVPPSRGGAVYGEFVPHSCVSVIPCRVRIGGLGSVMYRWRRERADDERAFLRSWC